MFEPAIVESGNYLDKGRCRSLYVRVAGVGSQNLVADPIIVELHVKSVLDVGDRALRPNIKIVGADPDDLQVVRLEKVLNGFRFRRGGSEPSGNIGTLQPAAIVD